MQKHEIDESVIDEGKDFGPDEIEPDVSDGYRPNWWTGGFKAMGDDPWDSDSEGY